MNVFVVNQDSFSGGMGDVIGVYLSSDQALSAIKTFIGAQGRDDITLVARRSDTVNGHLQGKVYVKYSGQINSQLEESGQWFLVTRVDVNIP